MELKRVVVTGLGTINPLGKNVEEYWEGLRNGVSGAGPITRFDASKFRTTFACEIKDFNPNNYLDRKEVQKHDMYAQYAYIAAAQAIENSGLDLTNGLNTIVVTAERGDRESAVLQIQVLVNPPANRGPMITGKE